MTREPHRWRALTRAGASVLMAVASLLAWSACAPASEGGANSTTSSPRSQPPQLDTSLMSAPFREVLERARKAVADQPDSAAGWGHLGSLLDAHLFYEEALLCYEHAHQLAPDDFRWLYLPAVAMDFLGSDLDSVAAAFQAALVQQPEYPPLRYRFAEALLRQGAGERAQTSFRKAIELDPNFALARRGLGQALLSLGRLDEALTHLERAREIDPTDSVVHAALARAYHLKGDTPASQQSTERARTTRANLSVPDPVRYAVDQLSLEPTFLTQRAAAALNRQDFTSAERDLAILERIFPTDPLRPLRRAQCLRSLQRAQPARASFERALELGDTSGAAHAALADLLQESGDLPAALPHRSAAVEQRPEHAGYRNSFALALAMGGDLDRALEEFAACATLAPPTSEVHHNWGTTLLQQNRLDEAVQHYEAALQQEPTSAGTLFNMGTIHEGRGLTPAAIEFYQRAVASDSNSPAGERLRQLGQNAPR